jgi:hypothetical protein
MKDLTVNLEDRPGTLATLGETLGGAGINIEGLCAVTYEGRGIVHILVQDAAKARSALEGAGIKVEGESEALVSELPQDRVERPGALGEISRRVADAGVNVQVVYLATKNRAVIVTSDNAKAKAAFEM